MASVTYDGRSFMLDGRRIWLVAGSIHYARCPRDQWADRIHAAKLAGLNAVETPVFWNRHEPRPGFFDFKGDNDLRHFVERAGQAGLYVILRVGPYVGAEWDMGGLPSWLLSQNNMRLRTSNGPFLEACSRYLNAVADQVRDLQVTSAGKGGPIIAVQNEAGWTCGNDDLAAAYLGELDRYLREAGITVPTLNSNNLWQSVEGEIDCWHGSADMVAAMRQFTSVRADQPRVVIDFDIRAVGTWGAPPPEPPGPWEIQRRLAEVLIAGGQFNLQPFHGGSNFGFWGGRLADGPAGFVIQSHDQRAPIGEAGAPGRSFHAVRRLATFASRFGRVFANLDPSYQPVVIDPGHHAPPARAGAKAATESAARSLSVVHARGSQGGVVMVFADPPVRSTQLLLPSGVSLPVELGEQSVAWCLFDTHISGRAVLDYCNLNAFATVGRVLVCYGPAGARGVIAVNGSPIDVVVPSGKDPLALEHEGLTLLVLNETQIDQTYISDDAVYIGASALTADGRPIPAGGARSVIRFSSDGQRTAHTPPAAKPVEVIDKLAISGWTCASMSDYVDGTSARFASIPGPADLTSLGSAFGYGWYRVTFKSSSAAKAALRFPQAGDRLHLFAEGKAVGVVGFGAGAVEEASVPMKKNGSLVILAENLGRFSAGMNLGERKGVYGHAWECADVKLGKAKIVRGDPVEVLNFLAPFWEVRVGDSTHPDRITWTMTGRKKGPMLISFTGMPVRALLLLNDKPVAAVDRSGPAVVIINHDDFSRGNNRIQLALLQDSHSADHTADDAESLLKSIGSHVAFAEGIDCPTLKADWAFAKWEPPSASAFQPAKTGKPATDGPAWWKARFTAGHSGPPLHLELTGMTKGQVYINDRHLGRYFNEGPDGKPVPGQSRWHVPRSWLRPGENEIMIFDEHGGQPAKVRLIADADLVPITARG
ncbi:MAG: beta-galactosidase [Phycisphaerales bacterium]|nr:beta-galactosidase [Phycisphaerales bacterium]